MNVEQYIIPSAENRPIGLDIRYKNEETEDLVIFCHGFKGFKDWGTFNRISNSFAQRGLAFLKFNFSHNGTTPDDPLNFSDLEAFSQNTFSKELEDLQSVVDWVDSDKCPLSPKRIHIIGHSRGGGIAVLYASDNKISSLCTWASVADFGKKWGEEFLKEAEKNDGIVVYNGRTKQNMPMRFDIFKDYIDNFQRLSIPLRALRVKCPTLIVHGTEDEAVPYDDAIDLHKWITGSELLRKDGANHVFGGKHPWSEDGLPRDLQEVVDQSILFITKHNKP